MRAMRIAPSSAKSATRHEIQIAGLRNLKWNNIQAAGRRDRIPRKHRIILLSEAAGEPRQRHGPSVLP